MLCTRYGTEYGISVVTEAYVTDPGVAEQLENWMVLPAKENVPIPATTDLFLEIDRKLQLLIRRPRSPHHFLAARRASEISTFPCICKECDTFIKLLQ